MPSRLSARGIGLGLGLMGVLLAIGGSGLPPMPAPASAVEAAPPDDFTTASLPPFGPVSPAVAVRRAALLHTETPERARMAVLKYLVQRGDTASSIAERFGLKPETILWGNQGLSTDAGNLQVGLELNILPVDGVLHTVRQGDTLESLQGIYGIPVEVIAEFPGNGLAAEESPPSFPGRRWWCLERRRRSPG